MSNKLKTASSLSADSTQVRYQKALKEINKLIGVNTQLRQEISKYQEQLNQVQQKFQENVSENNSLLEEKEKLEAELKNVLAQNKVLSKENQQLKKQINRVRNSKFSEETRIPKKSTLDSNFESEKVTESQNTVYEFERKLEYQNEIVKELRNKLKSYEANGNDPSFKHIYSDTIRSSINNNELNKKLSVANQYIEKVNEENVNLKSRLIKAESSNKLLSVKSMDVLTKYTPQMSPRLYNGQSRNSEQVLKRYRQLEEENKRMIKKLDHLKYENEDLHSQNGKLKKQNANLTLKVTGYEALINKQQEIISDLHLNYEKDVTKMTEDFKQKLIDQRQNFSPAKSADHLKTIESLQTEIKGYKKKLNLYQIELTKYIKTFQIYKAKLSQCQKDVSELLAQKEQLLERLSKLQNSNRQRSNHSRGSTSRIMVDNQRRNSMGDTGYFNYS